MDEAKNDPVAAISEWLDRPARHEAAHAVVAVRLGLRVETDIKERGDGSNITRGRTTVVDANPEEEAIVAAAAIAADEKRSARFWDDPNACTASDVEKLADYAQRVGVLGCAEDFRKDPAFWPWATEKVQRAHGLLCADGGAAWERIREALLLQPSLSDHEVRALVAEADKESGYRPQSL